MGLCLSLTENDIRTAKTNEDVTEIHFGRFHFFTLFLCMYDCTMYCTIVLTIWKLDGPMRGFSL